MVSLERIMIETEQKRQARKVKNSQVIEIQGETRLGEVEYGRAQVRGVEYRSATLVMGNCP